MKVRLWACTPPLSGPAYDPHQSQDSYSAVFFLDEVHIWLLLPRGGKGDSSRSGGGGGGSAGPAQGRCRCGRRCPRGLRPSLPLRLTLAGRLPPRFLALRVDRGLLGRRASLLGARRPALLLCTLRQRRGLAPLPDGQAPPRRLLLLLLLLLRLLRRPRLSAALRCCECCWRLPRTLRPRVELCRSRGLLLLLLLLPRRRLLRRLLLLLLLLPCLLLGAPLRRRLGRRPLGLGRRHGGISGQKLLLAQEGQAAAAMLQALAVKEPRPCAPMRRPDNLPLAACMRMTAPRQREEEEPAGQRWGLQAGPAQVLPPYLCDTGRPHPPATAGRPSPRQNSGGRGTRPPAPLPRRRRRQPCTAGGLPPPRHLRRRRHHCCHHWCRRQQ